MRMKNKCGIVTAMGSGVGRLARLEEIANAAFYPLSYETSFIRATTLAVDGGSTA
ncbi:MAG: hypothetical protein OXF26_07370 [Alphaproteobacteria bacterium]|nr:hypothetical protein [Alphaproteobacteria bacterium]MCY4320726.1 hypothetical protein [Alphaproteobacteria bacterium]